MDWDQIARYRLQAGAALGLVILGFWYVRSYSPRRDERAALVTRENSLQAESTRLAAQIADEQNQLKSAKSVPRRIAPETVNALSPVDRLKYFLENITGPANALDLNYFTVTPLPPATGPSYQEIPFSISVVGAYPSLADFLYQLEYERDFVVREPTFARTTEGGVRADFQLAAILLTEPMAETATAGDADDPGRPTSLELARDPFTRPPAKLGTTPDGKTYFLNVPPGLRLTGIMRTDGRWAAIINREPYREGDSIDNKTITKISDLGVEMKDSARAYFLEMERPPYSTTGAAKEANGR